MRRLLVISTILALSTNAALAQDTPVFKPLDPSMQVAPITATPAPSPTVATPAPAPAAAPASLPVARNGEVIDSVGGGAIPSLPLELTTENGVSYISGGIGDEEKDQLKTQEGQFNLRLQIVGLNGEFLSDVRMVLKDAKGATLVSMNDAGPFVYMQVAPGQYSAELIRVNGNSKTSTLKVPAKGALKTAIRF